MTRVLTERTPPWRASSIAPIGRRARATSTRRSAGSPGSRVRLHLKPGQRGTKRLLAQYGDRLICVRYRYDPQRKKRLKTVELIVAEHDWEPCAHFSDDQIVGLRVAFAEVVIRDRLKRAGGRWDPERRLWRLRYDLVVALGLNNRIVEELASNSRCPSAGGENLHADTRAASR